MSSVLFFSNRWGPKSGGINSFNYDLARSCGAICKGLFPVGCLVPDATDAEKEDALINGVELISLKEKTGIDRIESDTIPHIAHYGQLELQKWKHIVGHDIMTGPAALRLASSISGRSALFIHTHYGAYKAAQDGSHGLRQAEKEAIQAECVRNSHRVFGVGPLLTDAARDLHGGSRKEKSRIQNFPPGIHALTPRLVDSNFFAITIGRFDMRNDVVKQQSLAVAGYGAYIRESANDDIGHAAQLRISVVGLSEDEQEFAAQRDRLDEILFEEAGQRRVNLACHRFTDRHQVWDLFDPAAVGMMLSWHEGFGLAGLEMIAAGLPLILSKNSGLCRFLDEKYTHLDGCYYVVPIRGPYSGESYNPSDVHEVSAALRKIARDLKKAQGKAIRLRQELIRDNPWDRRARAFLKGISKDFRFGPTPNFPGKR